MGTDACECSEHLDKLVLHSDDLLFLFVPAMHGPSELKMAVVACALSRNSQSIVVLDPYAQAINIYLTSTAVAINLLSKQRLSCTVKAAPSLTQLAPFSLLHILPTSLSPGTST